MLCSVLSAFLLRETPPLVRPNTAGPQTPHSNSGTFVDYALSLPTFPLERSSWALLTLLSDLWDLGKRSFSANQIFIPVLNAVNMLLESGGLDELEADVRGSKMFVHSLSRIRSFGWLIVKVRGQPPPDPATCDAVVASS